MRTIVFLLISIFQIIACCPINEEESMCDDKIIIDKNLFDSAPNSPLSIKNIEIVDDCLSIDFYASGCNGNSWKIKLIDSEAILKSNPPQRNLRLSLENNELCDAIINKKISFDISKLRLTGSEVILNIANSGQQIKYKY
jgi:hypothetical protein